jgi:peptide deformylase
VNEYPSVVTQFRTENRFTLFLELLYQAHRLTLFAGGLRWNAMPIKPLIILPDPILRQVSKPVERVDAPLRKLADDMLATMYDAPGIGLAAIQIGEPLRLLVIDLAKEDETPAPHVFINPEILSSADTRSVYEEGCLSIPDYYAEVERPASVRVKYLDRDGKLQEMEAEGLMATCLQHEIDHLNGVLFIDHISKLKRDMVVKKFKKLARDKAPGKLAG